MEPVTGHGGGSDRGASELSKSPSGACRRSRMLDSTTVSAYCKKRKTLKNLPTWYMVLSEEAIEQFKKIKRILTTGNASDINVEALYKLLLKVDHTITEDRVKATLEVLKPNKHGRLNFTEFLYYLALPDHASLSPETCFYRCRRYTKCQCIMYSCIIHFAIQPLVNEVNRNTTQPVCSPHILPLYIALVHGKIKSDTGLSKTSKSPYLRLPYILTDKMKRKREKNKRKHKKLQEKHHSDMPFESQPLLEEVEEDVKENSSIVSGQVYINTKL